MQPRDGYTEIEEIIELLTRQIAEIKELNNSDTIEPRFINHMLMTRFHQLGGLAESTAMAIAVNAVRNGEITKRGAADRLQVHPHTIDRQVTRFEEKYKGQQTSPLSPEILNSRK